MWLFDNRQGCGRIQLFRSGGRIFHRLEMNQFSMPIYVRCGARTPCTHGGTYLQIQAFQPSKMQK